MLISTLFYFSFISLFIYLKKTNISFILITPSAPAVCGPSPSLQQNLCSLLICLTPCRRLLQSCHWCSVTCCSSSVLTVTSDRDGCNKNKMKQNESPNCSCWRFSDQCCHFSAFLSAWFFPCLQVLQLPHTVQNMLVR